MRNPLAIRALLALFTPLRILHRLEIENLARIPDGPCLLVANHNMGAVIEIAGILYAWEKRFGFQYDRHAYGLAHHLAFRVPGISHFLRGVGAVRADYVSAKAALDAGAGVLVFPGGNWEATRTFAKRNEVDFHNQRGWIRVAKNSNVPIIPVAVIGGHALNPVFGRSRILAKLTLFDFILKGRWLPLSLGQFLWSGLFLYLTAGALPVPVRILGFVVVFCTTPLFPVWPGKVTLSFGEPISSALPDDELYARVTGVIGARLRS